MTTYDRQTEQFTTSIAVSLVIPVHVQGVNNSTEAEIEACKAIVSVLGMALEGMDVSRGNWPVHPFVELAEPTSIEAEKL